MIDVYDSEAMIKVYRLLSKKCDAIDRFINNHAMYFSMSDEYGTLDICENIIELMDRKNQLINLKLIIDKSVAGLSDNDKKILYLKMNYNLSMSNICAILDVKERTAFRRLEHAFLSLADAINSSTYVDLATKIIHSEDWIDSAREDIKEYRLSFKNKVEVVNSL